MTEADYRVGLDYLREVMPDHHLLSDIARGYTFMNCRYLEKALQEAPKVKSEPVYQDISVVDDPQLASIHHDLKQLYTERAKLSNRFHDIPEHKIHDIDRKLNSKKIQELQLRIKRTMAAIDHYKRTGGVSQSTDHDSIPNDLFELQKLKTNLTSARSRVRKWIKQLSEDKEKNAAMIAAHEKTEQEYTGKINRVNQRITLLNPKS